MNQEEIKTQLFNFLEEKNNSRDNYTRCCILSGEWGVGKTHVINEIIARDGGIYGFINVSLFGINSSIELKTRILEEICRGAKKFAKAVKVLMSCISLSFSLGAIGSIGIDLSKISDALNNRKLKKLITKKEYVVILDDIERKDNKLSIVEVLGTVDELLKNTNIKVILVTNFDKFSLNNECSDFRAFKEKVAKRTYELNNVDNVISDVIKLDGEYALGKNLRTIIQFKEILEYIDSCRVNYPFIIKQIIYKLLKVEKEKIDLRQRRYLQKINAFYPSNRPTDEEIKRTVDAISYQTLVVDYALEYISLTDNEKQYTEESVKKAAKHIYYAISDGSYNHLLNIPALEYGVFVEMDKNSIAGLTKEEIILRTLEYFDLSMEKNTIRFRETALEFCNFLFDNYSKKASNSSLKDKMDSSIDKYIKIMSKKSVNNPSAFTGVVNGINESLRTHPSNTLANKIKGDLTKSVFFSLVELPYESEETFYKSTETLNSFLSIKSNLNPGFIEGFSNNFQNLEKGVEFIYKKCEGDISDYEWNTFNTFFRNLYDLQLSTHFKKHIRTNFIKGDSVVDNRLRELIALL